MSKEPGQQPGESDRQYMSRMREADARRKRADRDEAREFEAYREATNKKWDQDSDAELESFAKDMFGMNVDQIQSAFGESKDEAAKGLSEDLSKARNSAWTKAGRNKATKKFLRKNRAKIKKSVKKRGWFW